MQTFEDTVQSLLSLATLPPEETAKHLGVSVHTLKRWRQDPEHPLKWFRLGKRLIRYRFVDILTFLKQMRNAELQN